MRHLLRATAVAGAVLVVASSAGIEPSSTSAQRPALEAQRRDTAGTPELPRIRVEIPDIAVSGRTIHVPAGGDLHAALEEAVPGDRITLEAGATYTGPFRLRRKNGNGWIVIASAARDLPAPGRHVTPGDAGRMPRLTAASGAVIDADHGAHHYRLVGLEIAPASGTSLNTLVRLGEEESSIEQVPHHIIIERCYIHGDPKLGGRRGVALNASHAAVIDSYLADFKERTVDAQAIAGWNGPGPFRITGNYLEASGENVMFGGADPEISGLVPADIEVARNHFAKPLRWKKDAPDFEGIEWSVKNLFELKNARRVLVDGNLFEYNWPHAQNGFAILFTVRNQDGEAPWSAVEDVTFANNIVRHVAAGINVLGRDDNHESRQTRRIAIRNNLFTDVGGRWGNGRLFQLLDGTSGVTIDHNTALQTGSILFGGDNAAHTGFVFQNNLMPHNEYGITGSGTAPGQPSLERYFPDAVVRRNVIVGAPAGRYPKDNFFPATLQEIGISAADVAPALRLRRPYAGAATDGRDPGANVEAVEKALGRLAARVRLKPDATSEGSVAYGVPGSGRPPTAGTSGPAVLRADLASAVVGAALLGPGAGGPWSLAELVFWGSFLLLGYVYFGYPVVAVLRARWRPRVRLRAPIEPSVSIVVVAHNEQDRIAARIENLFGLEYPADRLEIVIASDGSTDRTVDVARGYARRGVMVRPFARRRGKPAVLNAVVPTLRGEIVLFADARQRFDPGALRALVENFADPTVGAVSGELLIATGAATAAAGHGTAFYWRYEKFIRATEGRVDSTVGATGAIYAIRRSLFEPIPDDTILDDVVIPLRIVRRGYRVLFEPGARAYDIASATARQEFARKTRTIAGTFQLFAREPWLLSPWRNRLWFETISHKGLRLGLPVLHVALLVASCALLAGWLYLIASALQMAFYGAALAGYAQREAPRRLWLFSVPCAICLLSWATVVGFLRFATGRQQVTWDRVAVPQTSTATSWNRLDSELMTVYRKRA